MLDDIETKKTIAINNSAYQVCRTYSFHTNKTIKEVIESAIAEYVVNHPADGVTAPTVIKIGSEKPGRPVKKKAARVLNIEAKLSAMPGIPIRVDSSKTPEIPITLDVTGDHVSGFLPKPDTITEGFTALLTDNGEFFNYPLLEKMQPLQNFPNILEVRQDGNVFYPVNEQALIILSWLENREHFSKEILFLMHRAGLKIAYVD